MVKKFKDLVKTNPEPAKGTVGVNPTDPWSTKANLAEGGGSLEKYLLSRGINPKFVSKDTKISHAKSSAFQKWRQDHQFEETELSEDVWLDKFLSSRGINPKFATKDVKISYAKSGAFEKWKRDHQHKELHTEETDKSDIISVDIPLMIRLLELAREDVKDDMELHRITERLIEIRNKGTLTMDDYDFIAGIKKLKEELEELSEKMKDPCWKGYQMVGTKKKSGKTVPNCVPEEKEIKEWTLWDKLAQSRSEYLRVQQLKVNESKQTALQKFRAASAEREKKHNAIEKARQEKLHQDPSKVNVPEPKMKDGMSAAIDRLEKALNKEEVEQIDELNKDTLKSYRDKSMSSLKSARVNRDAAEAGKDMSKGFADLHAKSDAIAKKRAKGLAGYLQRKHGMKPGYEDERKAANENTLDPQAATEAPCDCANGGEQLTPAKSVKMSDDQKKQMTKSARIIKSLYKKKGIKEDMTDWEKEDKSVQTYGKKPKLSQPDEKTNFGENKPSARVVMSGGTTLTGEKRDTVVIDPLMKNRPGPDTFGATGKKASQQ